MLQLIIWGTNLLFETTKLQEINTSNNKLSRRMITAIADYEQHEVYYSESSTTTIISTR